MKAPHCRVKGGSHNHSMPCVLSRCFIINMILFLQRRRTQRNTRIGSDLSWVSCIAFGQSVFRILSQRYGHNAKIDLFILELSFFV